MRSYSSKEYNQILEEKIKEINDLRNMINKTNDNIEDRLEIINIQNEVNYIQSERIKEVGNNEMSALLIDSINEDFSTTGITSHPSIIGTRNNIFNLSVSRSNLYHFREDVQAKIDKIDVTHILKHDSIPEKNIELIKSEKDTETITIEKINHKMGSFIANSIEFDTYIKDIIDIIDIKFYKNEIIKLEIGKINNIGKSLHPLHDNIDFDKVTIKVKSNYQKDGMFIYPIKHIYFYNALFDNKSYCLYEKKLDNNLSFLEDKITITTDREEIETSLSKEKIKIFIDPEMTLEILPDIVIGKDITVFYAHVPLFLNDKIRSIKSIKFIGKYR